MKKLTILFFACLALTYKANAYEYLNIGDVRNSWHTESGTIDKAVVTVTPKGLYAECEMFLNFSTKGTTFKSGDSLEIQYRFSLPPNVEVTDLWLWVEDSIVKADIFDRWTASQIYEDIVKRRVDPALLVKSWDNDYELRIFPLMTHMPRKVKITFLVPIENITAGMLTVPLPLPALNISSQKIDTLQVIYYPAQSIDYPKFMETEQLTFASVSGTKGTYYRAAIKDNKAFSSLTLMLRNNTTNQFLGKYNLPGKTEGFYQLALNPSKLFNISSNKKTLFLFDYMDDNCEQLSGDDVLNTFKSTVLNSFTTSDSINIMFSGMITKSVSKSWLSANPTSLKTTLDGLKSSSFNAYSNLPTLLIDGINFIKNNGNDGNIVLIASSNSHGETSQANALIKDLLTAMGKTKIPIHIIDLYDKGYSYYNDVYIGGQYYQGNEYLYINLSMQTTGDYLSSQSNDGNYYTMLNTTYFKLSGFFTSIDVYATLQTGFTFSNYKLFSGGGLHYFEQPYCVTGKFTGSMPMYITVSAQLSDGKFYKTDIVIDSASVFPLDSVAKTVWAAEYIKEMLHQTSTNSLVKQIINVSMENRILTDYTAFLALEPGQGPLPDDPNDEEKVVGWDASPNGDGTNDGFSSVDIKDSINSILATVSNYPNPCSENTTIEYVVPKPSTVTIEVINLMGEKVAVLVDEEKTEGTYSIPYSVKELPAGLYFIQLSINDEVIMKKKMMVIR